VAAAVLLAAGCWLVLLSWMPSCWLRCWLWHSRATTGGWVGG
jgi:hypothetical protein